MLLEIALSVCLHTDLNCESIPVETTNLKQGIAGQAVLYKSGKTKIQVSESYIEDRGENKIRELLVHEYAHLITYAQGNVKSPHGRDFRTNCMALAELTNTRKSTCTSHANH